MSIQYPKYICIEDAMDRFSFAGKERIPEVLENGQPNMIEIKKVKEILGSITPANVKPELTGYWLNYGPYESVGGELKKSQQCPICNALYLSGGTEPWPNHPYCAECGSRIYATSEEWERMTNC